MSNDIEYCVYNKYEHQCIQIFAAFHWYTGVYNSGVPAKFMINSVKLKALNIITFSKLAKVALTSLHLHYFLVEHYLLIAYKHRI